MTGKLIIYGATGYTGQLVSEQAKRAGLDFIVAGRDTEKVRALAEKLGVPISARHGSNHRSNQRFRKAFLRPSSGVVELTQPK